MQRLRRPDAGSDGRASADLDGDHPAGDQVVHDDTGDGAWGAVTAPGPEADMGDVAVTFDQFDGEAWLVDETWVDIPHERGPISRRTAHRLVAGALVVALALLAVAVTVVAAAIDGDDVPRATGAEGFTLATAATPRRLPGSPEVRWGVVEAGVPTGEFAVGEEVAVVALRPGAGRSNAAVIAYDLTTGEERWRRGFGVFPGRSQVTSTRFGIVLVTLAGETGGRVFAYDEATGERRWSLGIGEFDGVFVLPTIDAVLHVGDDVRYVDPDTGRPFATIPGTVLGADLQGVVYFRSGTEVVAARVVDGELVEVPIAQVGGRRLSHQTVVDGRVIGFDDDGAAWALAAPADPSASEQRIAIVGLDEPDEFDVSGIFGVVDSHVLVTDDNEMFGMELVDDELVVRWARSALAFTVSPTLETFVVFAGDAGDRSRPNSPTRLLDARNGRWLGPLDGVSIVDPVELFDDGVVVDQRSGEDSGDLIAYDYYGIERWRTSADVDEIGIADGTVVVTSRTPGEEALTITAIGLP